MKKTGTLADVHDVTLSNGLTLAVEGLLTLAGTRVYSVKSGRRTGYLLQRSLVSNHTDAKEHLADQGIAIIHTKDWNALKEAFSTIQCFRQTALIETPGWTGRYYALPSGKVFSPKGIPRGSAIFAARQTFVAKRGTLKGWREQIGGPLTGQVIPMIAVLAALAAPFLRIIGDNENFGFEFSGPPATGKTTSLQVMASVSGNPGNIPTFNATLAGFEDRFEEFNDGPFPVDEANLAERGGSDFIRNFAFSMANGRARETRYAKDRTAYRFVFASTSNSPFYDALSAANDFTAEAALQRLFPLTIDGEAELGVFDHLPKGFANSGALATHLKIAMEQHYGKPLERLLQRLVEANSRDASEIRNQLEAKISAFETDVGLAESARGKSRASTAFGLLYAAGCFAKMHKILPEAWDCRAACIEAYHRYRSGLPNLKPWRDRISDILARPETIDLRKNDLTQMSDQQVEHHGAFIRAGVKGRVELLLSDRLHQATFPDWRNLAQTVDFASHVKRDKEHATVHRQIRTNVRRERLACIVLPEELARR